MRDPRGRRVSPGPAQYAPQTRRDRLRVAMGRLQRRGMPSAEAAVVELVEIAASRPARRGKLAEDGAVRAARGSVRRGGEVAHSTRPAAAYSRVDQVLVASMAVYGLVLVALAVSHGIDLTPPVLLVATALLVLLAFRRRLPLREWLPFVAIALAYELIRGYQATLNAMVHVAGMIDAERSLLGGNLATAMLQSAFHPAHGPDLVAAAATVMYVLHVPLPIAVGAFLWFRSRANFPDYVAAILVLSTAAFITYLLLPVAPPWWAAAHGYLPGPGGQPLITYLQPAAFASIIDSAGLDGHTVFAVAFGDISPDQIASFPSIHAAYPFLAYLFARRVLGRGRWAVLAYAVAAWFSIIYLGDHYLVDVIGGIAYAIAAYWIVTSAPSMAGRLSSSHAGAAVSRWLSVGRRDGRPPGRGEQPAE